MNSNKKIFVFRKIPFQESDLIIHALSKEDGRISLLAKGAAKSRKRFGGGVLEPFNLIEVVLFKKTENTELPILTEARIIKSFDEIRKKYDKMELAFLILQGIYKVSLSGDSYAEELYNLLGHSLSSLELLSLTPKDESVLGNFKITFMLKLLFQQGVLSLESWQKFYLKESFKGLLDSNFFAEHPLDPEHLKRAEIKYQEYLARAEL